MFYSDYKSKKSDGAINVRGCYTPLRNKLDERLPYREYILRSVSESKGLKTQINTTASSSPSFRSTELSLFM